MWRILTGTDFDEAAVAFRLYWRSPLYVLYALLGILIVGYLLIESTWLWPLPCLTGPHSLDPLSFEMGSGHSLWFLRDLTPLLMVGVMVALPIAPARPCPLSINALALPRKLSALAIAVVLGFIQGTTFIIEAVPWNSFTYAYVWPPLWPMASLCLGLLLSVGSIAVPSLVLITILPATRRWSRPFIAAAATWTISYLVLACVSWKLVPFDSPYGPLPSPLLLTSGWLLIAITIALLYNRRTRLVTFITGSVLFTAIHIFSWQLIAIIKPFYLFALTYVGLPTLGLPPSAFAIIVDVVR